MKIKMNKNSFYDIQIYSKLTGQFKMNFILDKSEPSMNNLSPAKLESIQPEVSGPSGKANQNLSLDFGNLVLDKDNTTVKGREVGAKSQSDVSLDQVSVRFTFCAICMAGIILSFFLSCTLYHHIFKLFFFYLRD